MRLVVVLMLIYTYAFVDRVALSLVVEPIRADLGASDVQMGLLIGLGFALFYAVANIPAGYYVDRINRRKTIAVASVVWASMTVVCGTADTFTQLFIGARGRRTRRSGDHARRLFDDPRRGTIPLARDGIQHLCNGADDRQFASPGDGRLHSRRDQRRRLCRRALSRRAQAMAGGHWSRSGCWAFRSA